MKYVLIVKSAARRLSVPYCCSSLVYVVQMVVRTAPCRYVPGLSEVDVT